MVILSHGIQTFVFFAVKRNNVKTKLLFLEYIVPSQQSATNGTFLFENEFFQKRDLFDPISYTETNPLFESTEDFILQQIDNQHLLKNQTN